MPPAVSIKPLATPYSERGGLFALNEGQTAEAWTVEATIQATDTTPEFQVCAELSVHPGALGEVAEAVDFSYIPWMSCAPLATWENATVAVSDTQLFVLDSPLAPRFSLTVPPMLALDLEGCGWHQPGSACDELCESFHAGRIERGRHIAEPGPKSFPPISGEHAGYLLSAVMWRVMSEATGTHNLLIPHRVDPELPEEVTDLHAYRVFEGGWNQPEKED